MTRAHIAAGLLRDPEMKRVLRRLLRSTIFFSSFCCCTENSRSILILYFLLFSFLTSLNSFTLIASHFVYTRCLSLKSLDFFAAAQRCLIVDWSAAAWESVKNASLFWAGCLIASRFFRSWFFFSKVNSNTERRRRRRIWLFFLTFSSLCRRDPFTKFRLNHHHYFIVFVRLLNSLPCVDFFLAAKSKSLQFPRRSRREWEKIKKNASMPTNRGWVD